MQVLAAESIRKVWNVEHFKFLITTTSLSFVNQSPSDRQVFVRVCGERLRRSGVRDGVIDFRRIVELLWIVLCR